MIIEDEVVLKIKKFALEDENIRAIIFNGSRVNQNAPIDIFQDYDVMMGVNDPSNYLNNQDFIKRFGETIIVQHNVNPDGSHVYLMLFTNNIRIDMSFYEYKKVDEMNAEDSLSVIYLDKDGMLKTISEPNDIDYYVKKPSLAEYNEWTNEFWWCLTNVAKGIYRDELPYVKGMYEMIVRKAFNKIVNWYIGTLYDFKINPGKFGKWYKRYLPKEIYDDIVKTYSGSSYKEIFDSMFIAGKLFRYMGEKIATYMGYVYPINDDENVTKYLEFVRNLN